MTVEASGRKTLLQDVLQYHADLEISRTIQQTCDGVINNDVDRLGTFIQGLRGVGVSEHAIHLIRLVPVIHVAWADLPPNADQRQRLLAATQRFGIWQGMVAYKLLEVWLSARPDLCLFRTWSDYVGALRWATTKEAFEHLRDESVQRAELTAATMRSSLGSLLPSDPRQTAIQQIRDAF